MLLKRARFFLSQRVAGVLLRSRPRLPGKGMRCKAILPFNPSKLCRRICSTGRVIIRPGVPCLPIRNPKREKDFLGNSSTVRVREAEEFEEQALSAIVVSLAK